MQDLNDKVTGGTLTAAEWNEVPSELQNVITDTGQTPSGGDLNQLGKGIAEYSGNGDFYTDSGAVNAYVLSTVGVKQAPDAYAEGMRVRFVTSNPNTGASTVNVAGLGVKDINLSGGGDPAAGGITGRTELVFDLANDWFELIPILAPPLEQLRGMILPFAGNAVPAGQLECNGAAVSRTTYSDLFAVIGVIWGVGDGSTTFNLPDLRGEFIRGFDDGRGVDSGRALHSLQLDEFESHTHTLAYRGGDFERNGGDTAPAYSGDSGGGNTTSGHNFTMLNNTGGSETRPRNIAMRYAIIY